jgi:hypothetical protein
MKDDRAIFPSVERQSNPLTFFSMAGSGGGGGGNVGGNVGGGGGNVGGGGGGGGSNFDPSQPETKWDTDEQAQQKRAFQTKVHYMEQQRRREQIRQLRLMHQENRPSNDGGYTRSGSESSGEDM